MWKAKDKLSFLILLVKEIKCGPFLQRYVFPIRGLANKSYWPHNILKQKKYSKHVTGSQRTRKFKNLRFVWFTGKEKLALLRTFWLIFFLLFDILISFTLRMHFMHFPSESFVFIILCLYSKRKRGWDKFSLKLE